MKLASLFLILMSGAAVAAVAASDSVQTVRVADEIDYIIPAGSQVTYRGIGEYGTVHYDGPLVLSGDYSYGYVTDDPKADAWHGVLVLSFRIPEQEAARLPYWSRDQPVREIEIRNPDRFVRQVIGRADLARLRAGRIKRATGTVTIRARDLQTSIECDHQVSSVEFVAWTRVEDRRVATLLADSDGC